MRASASAVDAAACARVWPPSEGEEFPLRDLLTSMYFHPGIDGPSRLPNTSQAPFEAFAGQMEAVARQSGAGTEHVSAPPTALDEPGHLSTRLTSPLIAQRRPWTSPALPTCSRSRRTLLPWRGRERDLGISTPSHGAIRAPRDVMSSYTPGAATRCRSRPQGGAQACWPSSWERRCRNAPYGLTSPASSSTVLPIYRAFPGHRLWRRYPYEVQAATL